MKHSLELPDVVSSFKRLARLHLDPYVAKLRSQTNRADCSVNCLFRMRSAQTERLSGSGKLQQRIDQFVHLMNSRLNLLVEVFPF